MATSWQGPETAWLPRLFNTSVADDLNYVLNRDGKSFQYSVDFPGEPKIILPVDILMGGRRHGLGLLLPIQQVAGIPLARPALIQARYEWSPNKQKLLIAPGCLPSKPSSLESALGIVLSPTFESRCLSCHGQPDSSGSGKEGGVHCESCHGPGSEHLKAISRGTPDQGIVNPKRLSNEDSIGVCARCHVGLARFSDPSPTDLLVANQVRAIKTSECYRQSGQAFSCTTCHDPHNDAAADDKRSLKTCLGCHSSGTSGHASICPVNATAGCITCHMPSVEIGPLHLVDHLIRVHPEQSSPTEHNNADLKTQVTPVSEYLRMIVTDTFEAAAGAHSRVTKGESFYKVARDISIDKTASIGGYLGLKTISDLGGTLPKVTAQLAYGEVSPVVQQGEKWFIIQRLPRDFRWNAEQLQRQAEELSTLGNPQAAIQKAQESLMLYPQFLRAISFIGLTFAQSGNPNKGAEVLDTANKLYPDDAKTEFALASILDLMGDQTKATEGYRRVIALEPDFTAAYANLGMIAYSSSLWNDAIKIFRQGLQIDPLSADLSYDLGLALAKSGDATGASQASDLARKLEPGIFERRESGR